MCWPLLWALRQVGRSFATFGTYALVRSLKWIMRVLNSQGSRLWWFITQVASTVFCLLALVEGTTVCLEIPLQSPPPGGRPSLGGSLPPPPLTQGGGSSHVTRGDFKCRGGGSPFSSKRCNRPQFPSPTHPSRNSHGRGGGLLTFLFSTGPVGYAAWPPFLRRSTFLATLPRQILCHKGTKPVAKPHPKGAAKTRQARRQPSLHQVSPFRHVRLFKGQCTHQKQWHTGPSPH